MATRSSAPDPEPVKAARVRADWMAMDLSNHCIAGPASDVVAQIYDGLQRLAAARPVFHSEADFQQAFAWQLRLDRPDAAIRLETRPLAGESLFLDVAVRLDDVRVAIELKYLVGAANVVAHNETFELRSQGAHDVRRYDVVKDVARLERLVAVNAADVGIAVVLSNDPGYWRPGRVGTVDAAFRITDGAILGGSCAWAEHAGAGTTRTREHAIELNGSYVLEWEDYSDVAAGHRGRFRYLFITVPAGVTRSSRATSVA